MIVKTENALDRFIQAAREWFANEEDLERRWEGLRPILAELIADPDAIKASELWPDCGPNEAGRGENLIFYEDPDYGFAINGLIKPANSRVETGRAHDHGYIYTLYGVIDGHETIERYEPVDEEQKPDYVKVRETTKLRAGPGEIDLVKPYEIHRERNYDERSVAVIIRSAKAGSHLQGRYMLETGEYWQGYGPRQTPAMMFPE
jgi:hypothetical protein